MNGPEHYTEAERLLTDISASPLVIAQAQVHATLAVAAATAQSLPRSSQFGHDANWRAVALSS